jgi:hypothetical protein
MRFDNTPTMREDFFAEFKITLRCGVPVHAEWETVRAWSREHFAIKRELAAILVLHRPGLAGSHNLPHVHVFIPARKLTIDGFGGHAKPLCSDVGQQEAWESWSAFQCTVTTHAAGGEA